MKQSISSDTNKLSTGQKKPQKSKQDNIFVYTSKILEGVLTKEDYHPILKNIEKYLKGLGWDIIIGESYFIIDEKKKTLKITNELRGRIAKYKMREEFINNLFEFHEDELGRGWQIIN